MHTHTHVHMFVCLFVYERTEVSKLLRRANSAPGVWCREQAVRFARSVFDCTITVVKPMSSDLEITLKFLGAPGLANIAPIFKIMGYHTSKFGRTRRGIIVCMWLQEPVRINILHYGKMHDGRRTNKIRKTAPRWKRGKYAWLHLLRISRLEESWDDWA